MSNNKQFVVRIAFGLALIVLVFTFFIKADESINTSIYESAIEEAYLNDSRNFDPEMLNISISSDIRVDNESYSGRANISNILNSEEVMVVDINLTETDELIYRSPNIHSNETIEFIEISKPLEPGTHPAVASFKAYNKFTNEYITTVVVDIDVTVVKLL